MRKIFLFLFFMVSFNSIFAQKNDCGTKTPAKALIISTEEMNRFQQTSLVSAPYCVKVYITVFADNNGTNRADTDANILTNFQYMVTAFKPHNICFMLIDIKQANNSDLNDQETSEESELTPYLQSNVLNIFIHKKMQDSLNGNAYGLVNSYLSLNGSSYNIATMGHETGHCLGLYHTFETSNGKENVDRNGSCKDCDGDGDLLCDTPADPEDDEFYLSKNTNESCVYVGTKLDDCGKIYTPAINNMMTYGRLTCRNTFTYGQGVRMRYYISSESELQAILAQDNDGITFPITVSTWVGWGVARDVYQFIPAFSFITYNGTANYTFQAKHIVVKNGTRFSPSTGGKIILRPNPYCN